MFFLKKLFKDAEVWDQIGVASVMGLHIVSGTAVGFIFGWYLDKWCGTKPWLLLTFLVLGIIAGFMNMFRDAERLHGQKKKKRDADDDQPEA